METIQLFFSRLNWTMISMVCQIILLSFILYWILHKTAGKQSQVLFKGVLIIAILFTLAYLAKLEIIVSILQPLLPLALIALIVIFQPEIRRGLNYLGQMQLFNLNLLADQQNSNQLSIDVAQITLAIKELAASKFGALLVIESPEANHDYLSPGTPVNGDISSQLILSIFFPKSPLHDGATIIQQGKIKAAGVILPITDNNKLSHIYGTRHRAAVGLSEIFDCLCVVVSEETGSISVAYHGTLSQFDKAEQLTDYLNQFYVKQQVIELSKTISDSTLQYTSNHANANADNSLRDVEQTQAADA